MAHPQVATGFLKENIDSRRALIFNIAGRLKPGVTLAQAEARLKTLAGQLAKEYPNDNAGRSVALLPLAQATINPGFRQNMVSAAGLLLARRRAGAADRLRQRREPAAGARRGAPARGRACACRSAPRAAGWCASC